MMNPLLPPSEEKKKRNTICFLSEFHGGPKRRFNLDYIYSFFFPLYILRRLWPLYCCTCRRLPRDSTYQYMLAIQIEIFAVKLQHHRPINKSLKIKTKLFPSCVFKIMKISWIVLFILKGPAYIYNACNLVDDTRQCRRVIRCVTLCLVTVLYVKDEMAIPGGWVNRRCVVVYYYNNEEWRDDGKVVSCPGVTVQLFAPLHAPPYIRILFFQTFLSEFNIFMP